jgi:hypothetical protein
MTRSLNEPGTTVGRPSALTFLRPDFWGFGNSLFRYAVLRQLDRKPELAEYGFRRSECYGDRLSLGSTTFEKLGFAKKPSFE